MGINHFSHKTQGIMVGGKIEEARNCGYAQVKKTKISSIRFYRGDISLQTLLLLFKCSKRETKELFVSPANSSLVGK